MHMPPITKRIRRLLPESLGGTPADDGYTHIKSGTEVSGTLNACGSAVLVEGTQRGDIENARVVYVGAEGRVFGVISADEVIVAGTVDGEIVARTRCEVHATGLVTGSISAIACLWLEGARVSGQVRVGQVAPFGVPAPAPAVRVESSRQGAPVAAETAAPAATAIPDAAASRAYRMVLGQ